MYVYVNTYSDKSAAKESVSNMKMRLLYKRMAKWIGIGAFSSLSNLTIRIFRTNFWFIYDSPGYYAVSENIYVLYIYMYGIVYICIVLYIYTCMVLYIYVWYCI